DWKDRAIADMTSGRVDDLLIAASKVSRALRRQKEWERWLADTIGSLEPVQFELIDALGRMGAPILSTNYDHLTDRRLERLPITWKDTTEQIAFARLESCDTILHLHGFWRK